VISVDGQCITTVIMNVIARGQCALAPKKNWCQLTFENSNLNWLVMGTSGWCWNGGLALAGSSPAAGSKVPNRLIV
jgi:hypothetical protein